MDLVDDDALKEQIHQYAEDYRNIGYSVYLTSMKSGRGIEDIIPIFRIKSPYSPASPAWASLRF